MAALAVRKLELDLRRARLVVRPGDVERLPVEADHVADRLQHGRAVRGRGLDAAAVRGALDVDAEADVDRERLLDGVRAAELDRDRV